jgi:hypothetical protein
MMIAPTFALVAVRLAPCLERQRPLVELLAALAERVLLTLVGTGDVPIQRHRDLESDLRHGCLLVGSRG